jgi:hypothetical protein
LREVPRRCARLAGCRSPYQAPLLGQDCRVCDARWELLAGDLCTISKAADGAASDERRTMTSSNVRAPLV